jgi:hypothetical protein
MEYTDLTLTPLEGGNKMDTIKEHKIAGILTWKIIAGLVASILCIYFMTDFFAKFSNTKNKDEDESKKNVLQKA